MKIYDILIFTVQCSQNSQNLEQFATRCCQLHICHDVQEKTGQVLHGMDINIKGVVYQAHYHQNQSQDGLMTSQTDNTAVTRQQHRQHWLHQPT